MSQYQPSWPVAQLTDKPNGHCQFQRVTFRSPSRMVDFLLEYVTQLTDWRSRNFSRYFGLSPSPPFPSLQEMSIRWYQKQYGEGERNRLHMIWERKRYSCTFNVNSKVANIYCIIIINVNSKVENIYCIIIIIIIIIIIVVQLLSVPVVNGSCTSNLCIIIDGTYLCRLKSKHLLDFCTLSCAMFQNIPVMPLLCAVHCVIFIFINVLMLAYSIRWFCFVVTNLPIPLSLIHI